MEGGGATISATARTRTMAGVQEVRRKAMPKCGREQYVLSTGLERFRHGTHGHMANGNSTKSLWTLRKIPPFLQLLA
jgi:hypothetical protein